jgi:ERF superfamily
MARARAPVAEPEPPPAAEPAEPGPETQADDAEPQEPSQPLAELTVQVGSIHERMAAILAELPAIGKDTRNEQQQFMYRSHDDVLNALNPLLAKYGVYVVPEVLERIPDRRETARGSVMYEVNLLVRYSFIASDGSWIAGSAWGEGTDSGDKATNKAMTMAFKNVLAQSFAVSTQEAQAYDADGTSPEETVAAGTAARVQARADLEAEQRAAEAERSAKRRDRIGELAGRLDVQTEAEPGTWLKLTQDGAQAAFGEPYEKLLPTALEEIGKVLRAKLDSETKDVPEQIDFTVPF